MAARHVFFLGDRGMLHGHHLPAPDRSGSIAFQVASVVRHRTHRAIQDHAACGAGQPNRSRLHPVPSNGDCCL